MTLLHDLFGLVCHQDVSRSFTIAGTALPFCQRCTGLYLGLGIAFAAQCLAGSYKRGLPSRAVFYTSVLCLLIMPVFGFHVLDPGPAWRFWSGLIYGNGIAHLLLPATYAIGTRGRTIAQSQGPALVFWVQLAFVNTLPLWFPVQSAVFAYAVLAVACAGALGVAACLTACLVFLVQATFVRILLKGDLHGTNQS